MKKVIALVLALTLLGSLCACSSGGSSNSGGTKPGAENKIPGTDIVVNPNAPVDIYLRVYDFSGEGAKTYVENLQKENPDAKYQYYDEEFYMQTITEKERSEMLEKLDDVNAFSATLFEDYPGVYIGAEVNDDLTQITYQVNEQAYTNSMVGFVILLGGAVTLDQIQAYNLVTPDQREGVIRVINENGTLIYDSAAQS